MFETRNTECRLSKHGFLNEWSQRQKSKGNSLCRFAHLSRKQLQGNTLLPDPKGDEEADTASTRQQGCTGWPQGKAKQLWGSEGDFPVYLEMQRATCWPYHHALSLTDLGKECSSNSGECKHWHSFQSPKHVAAISCFAWTRFPGCISGSNQSFENVSTVFHVYDFHI